MTSTGFFRLHKKNESEPLAVSDLLASNSPQRVSGSSRSDDVVQAFDALALSGSPRNVTSSTSNQQQFVGGFHPPAGGLSGRSPYRQATSVPPSGPPPRPVMPMPHTMPPPLIDSTRPSPQSLTLQYALAPTDATPPRVSQETRRTSAPRIIKPTPSITPSYFSPRKDKTNNNLAIPLPTTRHRPHSSSDVVIRIDSSPSPSATPSKKLNRPRAASTPPTSPIRRSSSGGTSVQCSGITKAGKRCRNQVKVSSASEMFNDDDKRFCHAHAKEVLAPSGTYARKNGQWIRFADWIPDYLHPDTQIALREEMDKSRSPSDKPGYIYTFEIRDPDTPKTIKLKVGRAVNLVKRIDEWGKQCGSKEQVLRGFYPGIEEDADADGQETLSLMRGRVRPGEKGAWCHRLERLIHLELGDLVETAVYLEPGWPNKVTPAKESTTSPRKPSAAKRAKCGDCGQIHKEIFEFTRVKSGKYEGKEFELIVKPVIEKWSAFVEAFL